MINPFVLKKYAALILNGCLPVVGYAIGTMFYGLWIGLACFGGALLVSILASKLILKNPFTMMLEGKGLLVFNIDSTGIIRPFIVYLHQPFVKGKLGSDSVNDVYDRSSVLSLAPPVKNGDAEMGEGKVKIELDESTFNKSRFGMYHYPALIYNSQLKSCITKDMLSENEKNSFAEHGVLYLNRKLEELTSIVRDFGRYVVELTKPKNNIFKNKWFIIAVVALVIILIALFAKPVINTIMSTGGSAVSAFGSAGGNPVIPRG